MQFHLLATDGRARLGRLETPHATFETPTFMPVGTQATVKGITPDQLKAGGADPEVMRAAVRRTIVWAQRCRAAHRRPDQALFGIVQGGTDVALRIECAEALIRLDFPGYALGGFSVGETEAQMLTALAPS